MDLTHAEKSIYSSLSPQEVRECLSKNARILEENNYNYIETENGFRLDPMNSFSKSSIATDSYAFVVTGILEKTPKGASIHLTFDAVASGVLLLACIFALGLVGVASFFVMVARSGMPEYSRLLPTGVAIFWYIGLIGEQRTAVNRVLRLLRKILEDSKNTQG